MNGKQSYCQRFGVSVVPWWLGAAILFVVGALNLQAQEASTSGARPQAGEVNTKVSRVFTFVDKTGLGHQHAIEGTLASGTLLLGAEQSAGTLEFDMRSFSADTDRARRYLGLEGSTSASTRSQVTENMLGADVLNVARYPKAVFEIDSAKATGQQSKRGLPVYELAGQFTLHGKTRPVRIPVEVEQARGWLHVRGSFGILQTAYGITPFSKAFGAIGVADPLRIYGDLWVAPNTLISMQDIPQHK